MVLAATQIDFFEPVSDSCHRKGPATAWTIVPVPILWMDSAAAGLVAHAALHVVGQSFQCHKV